MKWLDKWFFKKFKRAWDCDAHIFGGDADRANQKFNACKLTRDDEDKHNLDDERAIIFKVLPASGGRVVETRFYDRKKDRSNTSLYIIPSNDDFGTSIEKILAMESLKQ